MTTNEQDTTAMPDTPQPAAAANNGWERDVLERLAFASLREQRAARRWRIFLRLLSLAVFVWVLWMLFGAAAGDAQAPGPHTALIEIDGTIEADGSGAADVVIPALNEAFEDGDSVGVILRINSPGGSPVQAGLINDEITRLRAAYPRKPLYVVVDEVCASGGYYIAAAADKIFVNKASIVGSIGVMIQSFGLTGAMEKLGVERRLLTAGENKGFLDPFSPLDAGQRQFAKDMIAEVHQQFIDVVRRGRGDRLKDSPEIFSGLFWTGARAVQLGLADDFGSIDSVARDVLKAEKIIDYSRREALPEQLLRRLGGSAGSAAAEMLLKQGAAPAIR